MDDRSFDRLARLLGGATDRRAGLKAALGALLAGSFASGADAGRRRHDRARGAGAGRRDDRDRDRHADDADASRKKKKPCRPIGGKCRKQPHCCNGSCVKPTNAKGKPARKGICLCVNEGGACASAADCCAAGGVQLDCVAGVCSRLPVPTGQPCVEGDSCADPDAACTFYRREEGRTAASLCLIGGGGACVKDQDCIDLTCTGGRCGGPAVVATGDACDPGQSVCRDLAASCARYQSAIAPDGHFCVLPDGETCTADAQCRDLTCQGGFCGRQPVDTGQPCDARVDTCRNHRAACTTYASGDAQTRCLLGDGETCAASAECIIEDCRGGVCQGGPSLVETGEPCSTDPAVNLCVDAKADCAPYRSGTGGPAGTHCVLPDGATCEFANQCARFNCEQETCAPTPIPTGQPCRKGLDVCENPSAECTVYATGGDPGVTRCLLPNGDACAAAGECEIALCAGVCGNCQTDAQCGNGVCAGYVCRTCTVDAGPDVTSGISNPAGITLFGGRIWVANHSWSNAGGRRIAFFDPANPATVGTGALTPPGSQLMDVGGFGDRLFVTNFSLGFSGVYEVDTATGNVSPSRWSGEIEQAFGIVFDATGNAWVSTSWDGSTYANAVYKVTTSPSGDAESTTEAIADVCGPQLRFGQPRFMAMGPGGYVYLACDGTGPGQGSILAWSPTSDDPASTLVRVTGDRALGEIYGVAFDGSSMYLSNFRGGEIRRFEVTLDGSGRPTATPGCVYDPPGIGSTAGLEFDSNGTLWVADFGGSLVAPTFNYSTLG